MSNYYWYHLVQMASSWDSPVSNYFSITARRTSQQDSSSTGASKLLHQGKEMFNIFVICWFVLKYKNSIYI